MNIKKELFQRELKSAFYSTVGKFINPSTFLVLIALSISLSWIPDGLFYFIEHFVSEKNIAYAIQLLGGIFILSSLFLLGWRLSKKKFPEFEMYSKIPDKKRNLILFLSPIKDLGSINKVKNLEELRNLGISWQMPAEAINYHLPKLENIFVILSSKSKGQFKEFKSLVSRVFSDKNINVIPIGLDQNINFEDIIQVQDAIRETYEIIENEYKGNEKDTIIDITGGQKVVSIVGALQTIINDREFQYVSTSDYSIKSFDIRYVAEEE